MHPIYLASKHPDNERLEQLENLLAVVKARAADRLRAYFILLALGACSVGSAGVEGVQQLSAGDDVAFPVLLGCAGLLALAAAVILLRGDIVRVQRLERTLRRLRQPPKW